MHVTPKFSRLGGGAQPQANRAWQHAALVYTGVRNRHCIASLHPT